MDIAQTLTPRKTSDVQATLLRWFGRHRRELPWRTSRDPYRVWVAEVMLQQTRISAVIPYYLRFLERFPDVRSLARARSQGILKLWSGLGYYSRARNLQKAAKEIVANHRAHFPRELEAVLKLPGIGHYTAAAVLSIAYDVPLAALDGNVARVLARVGAVRGDLRVPQTWRRLRQMADELLATRSPGDWNQALMELGEVVCTPQNPSCQECPIARFCRAYNEKLTGEIPAPRKKREPVSIRVAAAVLQDRCGRTLLVKDPGAHDEVLFSRLWQFPAVEVSLDPQQELAEHLRAVLGIDAPLLEPLPTARHSVTFRKITLLPFLGNVSELPKLARSRIFPLRDIGQSPVSSATRKIAAAAMATKRSNT
jgi:A/G-specific adenine glycosylase